jgi:hypothetical protein
MKLKPPFLKYLSAPRGSGKSFYIVQCLVNPELYYEEFDRIFLFTPSIADDDIYRLLDLPDRQIFTEFDENKINRLIKKKNPDESYLFIFDDMISDKALKNSDLLKLLAYNGRHMGVSVIVASQKSTAGITAIRTNADSCVIWRPRSINELEALHRDNAIECMNRKQFTKLIMDNTKVKHSFIYINYQTNEVYANYKRLDISKYLV